MPNETSVTPPAPEPVKPVQVPEDQPVLHPLVGGELQPMGVAETPKDPPDEFERPSIPHELLDPAGVAHKPPVMPGIDGLPFRGPIPNLRETDPDHLRPQVGYEAHADILDLSIREDLQYYRDVFQVIAHGYAIMGAEDRQYDPEKKNWRVFLRWYEQFTHMKPRPLIG